MNFEELNEWVGILLDKTKREEVKTKLLKFKEDEWLIKQLGSKFEGKDLKNMGVEDFVPFIDTLEKVVLQDYPIEDVVQYSALYSLAVNNIPAGNRFPRVLTHLNEVKNIEKSLVSSGINKNPNFKIGSNSYDSDVRLYIFEELSYLQKIRAILENSSDSFVELPERLTNFRTHLQDLKDKGIDLTRLFGCGYARVFDKIDEYNRKDKLKFPEVSTQVIELLKKLDTEGFDIYHKSSISGIVERLGDSSQIKGLSMISGYMSREAIMYMSGFHLKE